MMPNHGELCSGVRAGVHPQGSTGPRRPHGRRTGVPSRHTEEVEVQKDLVPRQKHLPVSVLRGLQERVDHLRSFSNHLLKRREGAEGGSCHRLPALETSCGPGFVLTAPTPEATRRGSGEGMGKPCEGKLGEEAPQAPLRSRRPLC